MFGSSSRCCVGPVGHEALDAHDVDRLVHLAARAGCFAVAVADPPADRREGVLAADGPVGIGIAFLLDQGDVAHGALVGRAGGPAGSHALLVDGDTRPARPALRSGRPLCAVLRPRSNSLLTSIGQTAAQLPQPVHLDLVHVARLAAYAHLVIADVTGNRLDFAVGQEFDVGVASHGHHFRCEYSGSTVERWEGLIELGHVAADGRLPFHQVDLLAGICQSQGGLDARNPAADHQRRGVICTWRMSSGWWWCTRCTAAATSALALVVPAPGR